MKTIKLDGQVFRIMQRLKKASIPVLRMKIEYRETINYHNTGKNHGLQYLTLTRGQLKKKQCTRLKVVIPILQYGIQR